MRLLWFLLAAFLRLARSLRPNVKRLPAYHTDLDEETKPPKPVLRQLSVNVEVPTSPDAHRVHSLPLFDDTENFPLSWAGHLPASADGTKYLFYWLFAPEGDEAVGADAPLVLWLNGGPGTSSMVGLFVENGPFQFVLDPASGHYSLQRRDYSWHKAPAYVLYLDQPVGTGYSFTTRDDNYPQSNRECGIDVHYFLQQFFQLHADKFVVRNNDGHGQPMTKDFYVTGESHAGQYIPAIMAYILERNDQSPDIYINLKAGAIGNGSTDPYWQWNTGVAAYGHGMLGIQHLQWLTAQEQICQANLDSGSCDSCFDWYKVIDNVLGHYRHGTNYRAVMYDIRKAKGPGLPSYPPYEDVLKVYLRGADGFGNIGTVSKQVVHALNAGVLLDVYEGEYFGGGLDELRDALDEEWVEIKHGAIEHVQYVLQHESVRLLFYNGVYDLACDHVGNELFLSNMEWKYQKEWLEATRYAWIAESEKPGAVSGYIKEYANLGFLKVMEAGHFLPMDVPNVALDMLRVLISGGTFATVDQHVDQVSTDEFGNWCVLSDQELAPFEPQPTLSNISQQQLLILGTLITFVNCLVCLVTCWWRRKPNHPYRVLDNKPTNLSLAETQGSPSDLT